MISPDDQKIAAAARQAAEGAYAPYSGFRVGAVVVGVDGSIVSSANVENAAFPSSQCAEANAIAYAVSQGIREIATVGVACIDADSLAGSYPCGRCRQIMSEFDVERVLVTNATEEIAVHALDDLIPHRFSNFS
jgi:cytidine deaminase